MYRVRSQKAKNRRTLVTGHRLLGGLLSKSARDKLAAEGDGDGDGDEAEAATAAPAASDGANAEPEEDADPEEDEKRRSRAARFGTERSE